MLEGLSSPQTRFFGGDTMTPDFLIKPTAPVVPLQDGRYDREAGRDTRADRDAAREFDAIVKDDEKAKPPPRKAPADEVAAAPEPSEDTAVETEEDADGKDLDGKDSDGDSFTPETSVTTDEMTATDEDLRRAEHLLALLTASPVPAGQDSDADTATDAIHKRPVAVGHLLGLGLAADATAVDPNMAPDTDAASVSQLATGAASVSAGANIAGHVPILPDGRGVAQAKDRTTPFQEIASTVPPATAATVGAVSVTGLATKGPDGAPLGEQMRTDKEGLSGLTPSAPPAGAEVPETAVKLETNPFGDLMSDAFEPIRPAPPVGGGAAPALPDLGVPLPDASALAARAETRIVSPVTLPQLPEAMSAQIRALLPAEINPQTLRAADGSLSTEMELAPAELGRLRVVLQTTERGLHLFVAVERPEALDQVRRHLEGLHRALIADGVTLDGVDIGTGDSGQSAFADDADNAGGEADPSPDPVVTAAPDPAPSLRPMPAAGRLDISL